MTKTIDRTPTGESSRTAAEWYDLLEESQEILGSIEEGLTDPAALHHIEEARTHLTWAIEEETHGPHSP